VSLSFRYGCGLWLILSSEIAGDFGSKPLYRNLGYFSNICLLRVHVLLGDPTRRSPGLESSVYIVLTSSCTTDYGECRTWRSSHDHPYHCLSRMSPTRVTRSELIIKVTTYYHVGCAYMALGRWPDAIKTFVSVLIFFVRMKPYHTRSYQYGSVSFVPRLPLYTPDS
jgi:translation initiation factor 3 subunit L